jgi:hypothetical protein
MIAVHGRGNFAAFLCFLEDSNAVGYSTQDNSTKKYNAIGGCFAALDGDEGTFTLGGVTATGFDYMSDFLYVMNPDDSSADATLIYLGADDASAFGMTAGWYDAVSLEPYNNVQWSLGTGFMTDFNGGSAVLNYAGQVYDQAFSLDCSQSRYAIVANGLPRKITLGEVSATGYDYMSDFVYLMNPDDSSADATLIYLSADEASAFGMTAGWYDAVSLEPYATYELKPGDGFMTDFNSGATVLNFPKAIAAE